MPFGPVDQRTPLGRGYATYASDSGRQADTTRHPIASLDGWFGQNDEAVRNFSGDALKKVHDTATYVITKAFGRAPRPTSPAVRPASPASRSTRSSPPTAVGGCSLTALEKWAERGVAPSENQVVADGNPGAARTRPSCEWPAWPAYVGGPASKASSFRCEM